MREFAAWGYAHRDLGLVVYDSEIARFRFLRPERIGALLEGQMVVDTSSLRHRTAGRKRMRDRLPDPLRDVALWLLAPRRRAVVALESDRQSAGTDAAHWIERLQFLIAPRKLRRTMFGPQGQRTILLAPSLALDRAYDPAPGDILIFCGIGWGSVPPEALQLIKICGTKIAMLCHDIIPTLFPEFFTPKVAVHYRHFLDHMFRLADLVLFASRVNESDARNYCIATNCKIGKTALVRFGSNLHASESGTHLLPPVLEARRYALFVSTIEPRKGHRLLLNVWKRLFAEGLPSAHGFKLVLVGRRGWMMDDFLVELEAHPSYGDSLLHFSNTSDETLAALYSNAAFCVYPSRYEGYGLPIVEAFSYGRAVLASTGGALPEVVGDLSPCLDPCDEQVWYDKIKQWIEDPDARRPYEMAIAERFRPVSWQDAAEGFFRAIDTELWG